MKRLSAKARARQARRARRGTNWKTRQVRSAKLKAKNFQLAVSTYAAAMPFPPTLGSARVPLAVPRVLSLRDAYDDTVRLVNELRSVVLDRYMPVDLYFNQVEEIEPAAAMVLTAEIYRCRNLRRRSGRSLVNGTYPSNPAVYRQLQLMRFFRLLEIMDQKPPDEDENPTAPLILPFITDAEVTPERTGDFIDYLAKILCDTLPMDEQSQRYLYAAIIEAMKNAAEHAYIARPLHQPMGRRWWLTAAFDRQQREVSILLFDQGVGIPFTLEPDLIDRLEAITQMNGVSPSDSLMIEIATRPGRTSTAQAGRGRGFATMRKFVDACDDGDLLVYSNRGYYMHSRDGSHRADGEQSLGGTLIQWRVRHSSSVVRVAAWAANT
jgi:hypothetical protein